MNILHKNIAGVLLVFFFTVQSAGAMCMGIFIPSERQFTPPEHTRVLIVYNGSEEVIVIEPLFNGNAEDFGMILPVPSKPTIEEAPEDLFEQLEDFTNPQVMIMAVSDTPDMNMIGAGESKVVVVEQKVVGDYDVTVLTASESNSLSDWLTDNGYTFTEKDEENFAYYIDQGGFYFIAMKVTVDSDAIDKDDGTVNGRLSLIDVRFDTEEAIVPIRTVAGNTSARMTFTLYTLGDVPLFIPGN